MSNNYAVPNAATVPSLLQIGLPNDEGANAFLANNKWPAGLRQTLISNLSKYPIRFFIVDDSGSMMTNDGHITVSEVGQQTRTVSCSRWKELVQSMDFVANLANAAKAPTEFRLLNNSPTPIYVGFHGDSNSYGLSQAKQVFQSSPDGGTPLCRHVNDVIQQVRALETQLRANNQKAVVVIATDGESSDGDISVALRPIKDLPVQLIIRLCTNEEKIVNYWNKVEENLELNMDVLDDVRGEAEEISKCNNWLTYAEPLHILRVFGVHLKEFDLLDERKLSSDEMRNMCALILTGTTAEPLPHPEVNWKGFITRLKAVNSPPTTPLVWCTRQNKLDNWIKIQELSIAYNNASSSICIIS